MELPEDLRYAIESELSSLSSKKLAQFASKLSDRYRTDKSSSAKNFIQSRGDVDAYVAFRMPATFAAVYSALKQVQESLPGWSPRSLLDVGAGPGTVMWAASVVYPDLDAITLFEREDGMIALGKRLAKHSSSSPVKQVQWVKTDITGGWKESLYDLVTASYVLGELSEEYRDAFIEKLWMETRGTLVIIEPGTPDGFSRIRRARERLISEGGSIIAPCTHELTCPMAEDNWCHFSQRVSRSRLHRQVKASQLSYEDEKFSFIAASRKRGEIFMGRVLRHPQVRKGHINFEICSEGELVNRTITRKDRELYRYAKGLGWGSAFL